MARSNGCVKRCVDDRKRECVGGVFREYVDNDQLGVYWRKGGGLPPSPGVPVG